MNSYWQVLRTYLWRPRFWVLGFFYLLLVWGLFLGYVWSGDFKGRGQSGFSAMFTGLAGCFLALHVRRQFTNDAAQLVPGYATPHLVIATLVSSLLWLVVPSAAILSGDWPPGALAFHACAAILMAAVICWPRAIVLLVAVPVLLVWESRYLAPGEPSRFSRLLNGELPVLAGVLIGLALLMQIVAGFVLLRLPRQGVTTNDEFSLGPKASVQDANPLNRWFLAGRDAAAERLLEARVFRSIQRWRIPVATSLVQFLIPGFCVLGAAGIGLVFGEWQAWTSVFTAITCAVLMFVPLSPWHARRHAMSQEVLLPVTRPRYFRQIILSMALDMVLWMTVASVLIAVVGIAIAFPGSRANLHLVHNFLIPAAIFMGLLWSMATFVFGVGLATMRWPLWLPIVAGIALVWFLGVWISLRFVHLYYYARQSDPFLLLIAFVALNFVIGLFLTVSTYRRWLRSDVA